MVYISGYVRAIVGAYHTTTEYVQSDKSSIDSISEPSAITTSKKEVYAT